MKVEVRIKRMNIISPFNSETLDTDELEEAERRVQDLRIMLIKQTAEARVAASSLDDKAAVERIASNEKQAKADLQFLAEVLAILVMIAESYDNRGLHKMRAESLRDIYPRLTSHPGRYHKSRPSGRITITSRQQARSHPRSRPQPGL
jgi:NADH dehydrogenase/NADH:ubiquinone oxidoreductase subunit G